MMVKIPVIGRISLDLGYIVLVVYCKRFGAIHGAIVGACGCFIVSLMASGWIAFGWPLGNLFIGAVCGAVHGVTKGKKDETAIDVAVTVVAVFIGVACIKTVVECPLYGIPLAVKFPKNFAAFVMDSITMAVGVTVNERLEA